jgi:hypothetical protein
MHQGCYVVYLVLTQVQYLICIVVDILDEFSVFAGQSDCILVTKVSI